MKNGKFSGENSNKEPVFGTTGIPFSVAGGYLLHLEPQLVA